MFCAGSSELKDVQTVIKHHLRVFQEAMSISMRRLKLIIQVGIIQSVEDRGRYNKKETRVNVHSTSARYQCSQLSRSGFGLELCHHLSWA